MEATRGRTASRDSKNGMRDKGLCTQGTPREEPERCGHRPTSPQETNQRPPICLDSLWAAGFRGEERASPDRFESDDLWVAVEEDTDASRFVIVFG